jgi:hypothetical protein
MACIYGSGLQYGLHIVFTPHPARFRDLGSVTWPDRALLPVSRSAPCRMVRRAGERLAICEVAHATAMAEGSIEMGPVWRQMLAPVAAVSIRQ